jgi:hypothetical protein
MPIPVMAEAILSGLSVSILSKYLINNNLLFSCCQNVFYDPVIEHDDGSSSTTSTNVETEITHHIHAHVF